jgi:hypothetical protein
MSKLKKPKGPKSSGWASNLLASMPWLKNKAFLIPAIASVLVLSTVGVVSAVQGGLFSPQAQESAEVSLDDSGVEVVAEPVIGPECVEGEPVCEDVKSILVGTKNWEGGVFPWTYEELVESMMYQHNVTREFAVSVINAVEFDWGEDVTASGTSRPGSPSGSSSVGSEGSSSPSVTQAPKITTETPTATSTRGSALDDAKYHVDNFNFSRAELIDTLVRNFGHSQADVIAAIDSLKVNWNLEAKQAGESILRQGPFSPERIRGALRYIKFLDSEAEAGVAALGIDEYAQASLMARDFLMRQTPPCDFSYEQAFEYMTQREYFEDAPASYGLLEYLELDEDYNDVWLVCGR